jgi:regulation of enolase protein 1 (concanavalin A-like superfamily)
MVHRCSRVFAGVISLCMTAAAVLAGEGTAWKDPYGWGRVLDPSGDCVVSLDAERDRLKITVPGTPHLLSAEDTKLPMNAPRVVRRIRGDFTASVRVLGRLEPGRSKTTHYDPFHGAGLIVWQDPSNYLRLERAVGYIQGRFHPYLNYELREGGRLTMSHGMTIDDRSLFLKLRRQGPDFSAWYSRDGRRWVPIAHVDATLNERVEVGVVAVNSSTRTLTAELERFRVDDPQGSMARDDASVDDPEKLATPPPASSEGPPARRTEIGSAGSR